MSKEFKVWDKVFSKHELIAERNRWLPNDVMPSTIMRIECWKRSVAQWEQEYVQHCVYHAADAKDWQRFRVSLKGSTTREKLYCLEQWYIEYVATGNKSPSGEEWVSHKINRCRIDNYIGALVRGGQLDSNYRVIK